MYSVWLQCPLARNSALERLGWLRQSHTDVRHSTAQRSTWDLPNKFSVRGRQGDIAADEENQPPPVKQETTLQTQKHSAPQLQPTLGRNQQTRADQQLNHCKQWCWGGAQPPYLLCQGWVGGLVDLVTGPPRTFGLEVGTFLLVAAW